MKVLRLLFITCISFIFSSCKNKTSVSIENSNLSPQMAFALSDLEKVIEEKKSEEEYVISIEAENSCCEKGGFKVVKTDHKIKIIASEDTGLMYGVFEIAEQIKIGKLFKEIKEATEVPYIKNRGIKYNIPLDIRTSAFDDSGDAAQKNIETMWEFSFWEHFFDNMARHRYNVISFWNAHPFSSMIQLEEYPDVALQDVWGTTIEPQKNQGAWTVPELANIIPVENKKVLKKMSMIEELIFIL